MALDNLGNDRVDFIWGNMPLQRNYSNEDEINFRASWNLNYPGDGEAEYYMKGHSNDTSPSQFLDGGDSHNIALRKWNNFPYGDTIEPGYALYVDWWEVTPAFQYPNIIGKTLDEAVKDLKECGVDPATLVPIEFDAPDEFKYSGYNPDEDIFYDPINAPGADSPGVVIYRYYEPYDVIGTHWDGRPWFAQDSENCVMSTSSWIGQEVAVGIPDPGYFPDWHAFVVIQTKDPLKDSYQWWN